MVLLVLTLRGRWRFVTSRLILLTLMCSFWHWCTINIVRLHHIVLDGLPVLNLALPKMELTHRPPMFLQWGLGLQSASGILLLYTCLLDIVQFLHSRPLIMTRRTLLALRLQILWGMLQLVAEETPLEESVEGANLHKVLIVNIRSLAWVNANEIALPFHFI